MATRGIVDKQRDMGGKDMTEIKLAKPYDTFETMPELIRPDFEVYRRRDIIAERKEWQKEIKKLRSELADVKGGLAFAATTMNKLGLRQGVITGKIVNRRAEKAEAKLEDVASKLKKLTADWHMDAPLEEIEKLAEELSPDIPLGPLPTRQRDAK